MNLKKILQSLPSWILTVICSIAIAWLTLAPEPLGDTDIPLFPGADKLVHAIMFGGLTLCLMLDWQRHAHWRCVSWKRGVADALIASAVGFAVELAQDAMGMGRSKDILDFFADSAGAFIFFLCYISLQHLWSVSRPS